ncbi:conserved hypothetical protein [Rhizobium mesoamericanum STM3625]|uniref:Uncharacterized protein n=1 Tax=Rhizobium mesoamericanum STM3625 TaxID=1211777 RepID=K0PVH7_9HYPH|nr:conserved hypothetical protein [Rhizobium mesoamericanum STM3625]
MVECTALEMRHTCKGIVGSNPTLSAINLVVRPGDIDSLSLGRGGLHTFGATNQQQFSRL